MPGAPTKALTSDHVVHDDGSVAFACSQDDALWPWTVIGPHHPGAIQAASYWLSVECAMAPRSPHLQPAQVSAGHLPGSPPPTAPAHSTLRQ